MSMLNRLENVDIGLIDLERILEKQISDTEPNDYAPAVEALYYSDGALNRDLFGWAKAIGRGIDKVVDKILIKGYEHEKALKKIHEIAQQTIPNSSNSNSITGPSDIELASNPATGSMFTQQAKESQVIESYFTAASKAKEGKLIEAKDNIDNARKKLVDYFPGHKKLETLLQFNDALITTKIGNFDEAYKILQQGALATNTEASFLRGFIAFRQGNFDYAEQDFRIVYSKNPSREGINKCLAKTYDHMAYHFTEPSSNYDGVDEKTRDNWKQAKDEFKKAKGKKYARPEDYGEAMKLCGEVITALEESAKNPLNEDQKIMKARAKHLLGVIEYEAKDILAADKLFQESKALRQTPSLYTDWSNMFKHTYHN